MAASSSKKRNTNVAGKSAGAQKRTSGSRSRKVEQEESLTTEIVLWIVLAVAVLMLISNFGIGGAIGDGISAIGFGVFGTLAYIFPILVFIGLAFFISNRRNPLAYKKITAGIIMFLFLCQIFQLLTEGYTEKSSLTDFYQTSSRYHTGGGIIGGELTKWCSSAFGIAGAYIIAVAVIIICLVLVTQRSFFGFFIKSFHNLHLMFKNSRERRIEERPEREAQAALRSQRRAQKRQERDTQAADSVRTQRRQRRVEPSEGSHFMNGSKLTDPTEFPPDDLVPETSVEEGQQIAFQIHRSDNEDAVEDKKNSIQSSEADTIHSSDSPAVDKATPVPEVEDTVAEATTTPAKRPRSSQEEIVSGIDNIKKEIAVQEKVKKKAYQYPPLSLLQKGSKGGGDSDEYLRKTAQKLQDTLHNFGVNVTITNVSCGPTVTRYELQPEQGVKVSKIVGLSDDIKLNLATADIRIEAPIPGKAAVGIEVPNKKNSAVMLRDLLQADEFRKAKSSLAFAAGKDIAGKPVVADIAKMPHLLIAGATGSGKSVCINALIMSILYKASPDDVKLIMIDPKVVELSVYNGIPHLFIPVVTDPKKAAGALNWAVSEMTDRYNTFAEFNVRNLADYNEKISEMTFGPEETVPEKMPQIVIIVDELADLMMVAPGEVEDAICRLAQLARAAGIHMVIATQRPSVNVITGLIKANMPSRIAFSVSSGVDSRTILDMNGAEKLLGNGDMLFYPQGYQKPARLQGAYVSDTEVSAVVEFLSKKNPGITYNEKIEQSMNTSSLTGSASGSSDERDTYFADAGKFIIEKDKASIGMLQRVFKIGFNRAARIMDQLSEAGVVGSEEGTKPRKVLMSEDEFDKYIEEYL